ncbi:hypothetical protein CROQUDRAFT_98381 [Cronartium quercuum f. sp. fusiforme G11]|uniref:Uncharacterized protein n=1 Tax=Cronartium quercuum f. sp. fusiforme G11 TaxID=708437 RepID=A0A9P6T780_9BASI|nr:hypothetical protein CROQUDRAFT_98381 [Cronartium quercuum f. sp. fusiforme G11]
MLVDEFSYLTNINTHACVRCLLFSSSHHYAYFPSSSFLSQAEKPELELVGSVFLLVSDESVNRLSVLPSVHTFHSIGLPSTRLTFALFEDIKELPSQEVKFLEISCPDDWAFVQSTSSMLSDYTLRLLFKTQYEDEPIAILFLSLDECIFDRSGQQIKAQGKS